VKFRAIEALAGRYPVAPMCRLLRVSRSGFYSWQQRPPSAREMANRRLSKEIRTIHHEVNGIYGHRRIKAELAAMGYACGRHRVARLMREAGLRIGLVRASAGGWFPAVVTLCRLPRTTWIASSPRIALIGTGSRT